MANITIQNLDDNLKRDLRVRAAENGHPKGEEARAIFRQALDPRGAATYRWHSVLALFAAIEYLSSVQVPRSCGENC